MSAYVTANGKDCITARIDMPLNGAWTAELAVDSANAISGKVEIVVADKVSFVGFVRRGAPALDVGIYRVVAGGGGLNKDASAKSYRQTPLNIPLNDLIAISEDSMDETADQNVLSATLKNWVVPVQQVGAAINKLVKSQGDSVTWRILQNGNLWVGTDSWPAASVQYELLFEDKRMGMKMLDVDLPTIVPGVTLNDEKITYVQYQYGEKGGRTSVWTGDA